MKEQNAEPEDFFRAKAMTAVVESGLSQNAKMVAMVLLSHWSQKRPRPFPSVATIAREGSMSDSSARRALRELEQAKCVLTQKSVGHSSNRYAVEGLRHLRAATPEPSQGDRVGRDAHDDANPVRVTALPGQGDRPTQSQGLPNPVRVTVEMIQGSDPLKVTQGSDPQARAARARGVDVTVGAHEKVDVRARLHQPVEDQQADPTTSPTDANDITHAFLSGEYPAPRRQSRNSPSTQAPVRTARSEDARGAVDLGRVAAERASRVEVRVEGGKAGRRALTPEAVAYEAERAARLATVAASPERSASRRPGWARRP
jgi:hypothetical protein